MGGTGSLTTYLGTAPGVGNLCVNLPCRAVRPSAAREDVVEETTRTYGRRPLGMRSLKPH